MDLPLFIKQLEKLQPTLEKELDAIVLDDKLELVDLNKEQLSKGQSADETPLSTAGYSVRHKAARIKRGRPVNYVDFKYTGKFYASLVFKKISRGIYQIVSTDKTKDKVPYLVHYAETYGGSGEIFGLNKENADKKEKEYAGKIVDKIVNFFSK